MVKNVIHIVTPQSAPAAPPDRPGTVPPGPQIPMMRRRIDEIDAAIIQLWQERAAISQRIGSLRLASGGTRVVLAREQEVIQRFRDGLGVDGTHVALMLLRAGRGPL